VLFQLSPIKLNLPPIKLNLLPLRDDVPPSINITYPSYPPTILSGNIIIKGITNDSGGIKAISADAHTFPFNGSMPIKPAAEPSLISEGNWSKWSVPFAFNNLGVYRIVVTVRDNANNLGYAETTINVVPFNGTLATTIGEYKKPRIAFVRYTFTESAYRDNGFYDFYYKHGFPPSELKITTDLNKLTVKTTPSTPEILSDNAILNLTNITTLLPPGDEFNFWIPFIDHVKKVAPNATVTVIRDEDVHDGHIFYKDNKTNAYDVLMLLHNEYATQDEYDNLKQFVKNGGTIVFIDPNTLYAEVSYDRDNDTIRLVKGHDWEFDGKTARSSVQERWYNETKEWVGGNFLATDIKENITFTNNPFNYTHFEEQYVNNPKDKIIIDYGIKFPQKDYLKDPSLKQTRVATYTLDYGKGKVIMLGLTGHNLAFNESFMRFFDDLITDQALSNSSK
jgi:N,N-dimethylformamidase beta subunit-like, C-terminal